MPFKSYKKQSRDIDWGSTLPDNQSPCLDQLKLGAILRIADAAELMARNHAQLVEERDKYLRWYHEEQAVAERLRGTIRGLRSRITVLKKSLGD